MEKSHDQPVISSDDQHTGFFPAEVSPSLLSSPAPNCIAPFPPSTLAVVSVKAFSLALAVFFSSASESFRTCRAPPGVVMLLVSFCRVATARGDCSRRSASRQLHQREPWILLSKGCGEH